MDERKGGILFPTSSDHVGVFTRIFCKWSYVGVWCLENDRYTIILINPYILIEPRKYTVEAFKDLYRIEDENINSIMIKECTLKGVEDCLSELGFSGYLIAEKFEDVFSDLLSSQQVGVEAVNRLLEKMYQSSDSNLSLKFNYSNVNELEQNMKIFRSSIKIDSVAAQFREKSIPKFIVERTSIDLKKDIESAFDSLDVGEDLKHIKLDKLLEALQNIYSIYNSDEKKNFVSLAEGSYPAVLSVGANDSTIQIKFTDGKDYILTSHQTQLSNLTLEEKEETLKLLNVLSDGSTYIENIRELLVKSF